jgi:magnesium chelatase subunit I
MAQRIPVFPFSAVVAQEEMKRALICVAIDASIGGVLVFGDRGTGKSTALRGLAALLPPMKVNANCRYGCDPAARANWCSECQGAGKTPAIQERAVPVVDLPLGATEDRIVGALDLERVLRVGEKAFEPGLLARANRGFLYIDEVNLLDDHLVDLLIDVAASGENLVERDGLSVRHPARFVLVGSGNPEEGELRPQLLDRFGLSVAVTTPDDIKARVEVIKRREAFERDRDAFLKRWRRQDAKLRDHIKAARERLQKVAVSDGLLETAAKLCMRVGTDGLRAEITLVRAARCLASFDGDDAVDLSHIRQAAPLALRHRLRRDPLDESDSGSRVNRALSELDA